MPSRAMKMLTLAATLLAAAAAPADARVHKGGKYSRARAIRPATQVEAKAKPKPPMHLAAPRAEATPAATTEAPTRRPPALSRAEILATDAASLARIGRHIMVGYHSFSDVRALTEKRAIAGVFITDHNVRNRSAAEVRRELDELQAIRREQNLPPLIIAADQEGGQVSRLSPPLRRQPSLSRVLRELPHDTERRQAVEAYAETQASELARLGVTMNFGPVVDLKLDVKNRNDGETKLSTRAIDADPFLVAKVAGWYCDTLSKSNIMCTLKHFPGLGRVTRDTHVASAEISATEGMLELNDWVPFRRIMKRPNAAVMVGHVKVGAIDKSTPASFSEPVIGGVVRGRWEHEGILITDDFSMGAVLKSADGVGGAAVKSLNAGVDIVLVSYLEQHYDAIASALLRANAAGELKSDTLDTSAARIERALASAPAE